MSAARVAYCATQSEPLAWICVVHRWFVFGVIISITRSAIRVELGFVRRKLAKWICHGAVSARREFSVHTAAKWSPFQAMSGNSSHRYSLAGTTFACVPIVLVSGYARLREELDIPIERMDKPYQERDLAAVIAKLYAGLP